MNTLTIEDVCKKDFELFCDLWNYDKTIDENGFYSCSLTDRLFTSFCAGWRDSRKALIVELPQPNNDGEDGLMCRVEIALDKAGVSYK